MKTPENTLKRIANRPGKYLAVILFFLVQCFSLCFAQDNFISPTSRLQQQNNSSPTIFKLVDPDDDRFFISAVYTKSVKAIFVTIITRITDLEGTVLEKSKNLSGRELFDRMMQYFSNFEITNIVGDWRSGEGKESNLVIFNKCIRKGFSHENAALETWTGKQAQRYGFNTVRVVSVEGEFGKHSRVFVHFLKKKPQEAPELTAV